jgi:diaminohydroxyphosphoribosylaminopyrimidine deaminase/5-amino-6-(5-phosphoribosylamino)uracil reductase
MEDPFPKVQGRGFAKLRAHGIQVEVGLEREAAVHLNQPFLTSVLHARPFVIMKVAMSRDGYIAAAPGRRTAITSAASLRHAQQVRAQVDAIGVGSETVLVDDPMLTARDVFRERPLARVVFDRRLRMPPTARLLSTLDAGPVIVCTRSEAAGTTRAAALEAAGATIVAAESDELNAALRRLVALNIQSLVLEGGAALHASAWDARLVDFVQMYVAPVSLGPGGVPVLSGRCLSPEALVESRTTELGPDTLIEGYVHGPH